MKPFFILLLLAVACCAQASNQVVTEIKYNEYADATEVWHPLGQVKLSDQKKTVLYFGVYALFVGKETAGAEHRAYISISSRPDGAGEFTGFFKGMKPYPTFSANYQIFLLIDDQRFELRTDERYSKREAPRYTTGFMLPKEALASLIAKCQAFRFSLGGNEVVFTAKQVAELKRAVEKINQLAAKP